MILPLNYENKNEFIQKYELNNNVQGSIKGYSYQCMNCDEDLYKVETHRGKPYTAEEFNEICLMTQDLLLLDD